MKFSLKLNVDESQGLIYDCFLPEIEKRDRSSIKLKKVQKGIEFDITADDATAFRATVNSMMRLLIVYEKMKVKYGS